MKLRLIRCIRFVLWACLTLAVLPAGPSQAAVSRLDGNRFALVIGNAKYAAGEAPLQEPINDARDVAEELRRYGFDVETGENLTGDAMRLTLDRFYGNIKQGSIALIFFSGIGIQASGQNYLIPVDASIWAETDVQRDGIAVDAILGKLKNSGAEVRIALLDASRRNPFEKRFRSYFAGLAPLTAPSGTLAMYSAAPDTVASGGTNEQGLLVGEWLKQVSVPDLTAEEMLGRVRDGMSRASQGAQVPWLLSTLTEPFAFGLVSPQKRVEPPPVTTTKPVALPDLKPPPVAIEMPKSTDKSPDTAKQPPVADTPPLAPPNPPIVAHIPPTGTPVDDPAIKDLNGKIAANPNDQLSWYKRGQLHASKGAYQLALRDFDEVIRLNPRDVEAYNNRCWTRTVIGDLRAASKDCDEALRLRPGFADALDSRGLLNLKSGQMRNAIADFDAALAANPKLTSSLYGRGLAKLRNGAAADGERDIARAKAVDPNIVKEFAKYGLR